MFDPDKLYLTTDARAPGNRARVDNGALAMRGTRPGLRQDRPESGLQGRRPEPLDRGADRPPGRRRIERNPAGHRTMLPDLAAFPMEAPEGETWRRMSAADALAYLVAQDAARRTMEGRDEAYVSLRRGGIGNRKRLVAWRRENGLCPKCGRAIRADEPEFKHCRRCREAFREYQRHVNANLSEPGKRLARNERARRSYHKLAHGKAAPPKVVTPMAYADSGRPDDGPKRDRAAYMRAYHEPAKPNHDRPQILRRDRPGHLNDQATGGMLGPVVPICTRAWPNKYRAAARP